MDDPSLAIHPPRRSPTPTAAPDSRANEPRGTRGADGSLKPSDISLIFVPRAGASGGLAQRTRGGKPTFRREKSGGKARAAGIVTPVSRPPLGSRSEIGRAHV